MNLVARLARNEVNMPDYEGWSFEKLVPELLFEAATYELLRGDAAIRVSRLLYHRIPAMYIQPCKSIPSDISGRGLLVFEKAAGTKNVWWDLKAESKASTQAFSQVAGVTDRHQLQLLEQLAEMRAALFRFDLPPEYSATYPHSRIFEFMPPDLDMRIAPTREFWMHVLI